MAASARDNAGGPLGDRGCSPAAALEDRDPGRGRRHRVLAVALLSGVLLVTAVGTRAGAWREGPRARLRRLDLAAGSQPPLYFKGHEAEFAGVVAKCVEEQECRILLNHIGKTGGSSIETVMFEAFPPKVASIKHTCCFDSFMAKVRENPHAFCMAKFSAYQVNGTQFETVLKTCRRLHRKRPRGQDARVVVITSIREPVERAISHIHQVCNKNRWMRDDRTNQACVRCNYQQDQEFWDEFATKVLNGALFTAKYVTDLNMKGARHLVVDLIDLRAFFDSMRVSLKPLGVHVPEPIHKNGEKTQMCNFLMPSSMMRLLKPSAEIYRDLTANL